MKKSYLACITFICLVAVSCRPIESKSISLLDYTDKESLISYGLDSSRIALINQAHEKSYGYSRYEGYQKHQIGSFEVLSNPNNPDELYVIKDEKFILDIGKGNIVRLYSEDTAFPNPQDMSIYWIPDRPAAYILSGTSMYYDLNLDGVDIDLKKQPFKGDHSYNNFVDIPTKIPNSTITKAIIPNLQCEPLVGEIACCSTKQGTYQPYQFNYKTGWSSLSTNPKIIAHCNSGDIDKTRKELVETIFDSN